MSNIFPLNNSWLLLTSFALAIVAILLNVNNRYRAAIVSLFFAALAVRLFAAHLDPFLNDWDERYHALVARNMMHNPFKPMMIAQPYAPYDYRLWSGNHIWLHKQPLFLWQMALSMKLFGVSVFTMRYPSALMGALSVLLLYRIAVIGTRNRRIAFIAALLACYAYLALDMTSGRQGIDHNDLAFQFYVLASMWAFSEYKRNKAWSWAIAVGVLSGCAVLNKWLPGLLVFAGWAVTILFDARKKQMQPKEVLYFFLSVAVAFIVFVPWQLYILHRFPVEARYELNYNTEHAFKVIEGHGGDGWYYYDRFPAYFGNFIWVLLIAGLMCIAFLKRYHNLLITALVINFLAAFIFFSFIVPTKMEGFLMPVVPLGYLFMAVGIFHLISTRGSADQSGSVVSLNINYDETINGKRRYLYAGLLLLLPQLALNLPELTANHDPHNDKTLQTRTRNNVIFKSLGGTLPKDVKVVLNAGVSHDIDVMFYNNNITAYAWSLTEDVFNREIKSKNIPIAVFRDHGIYKLPGYVYDYPDKYIINEIIND